MAKKSNKAYGAYAAVLIKKIKKAGISPEALDAVVAAIRAPASSSIRIPMKIRKLISQTLSESGRAVISYKNGDFRVYSVTGYMAMKKNGHARAAHNNRKPATVRVPPETTAVAA